MILPKDDEIRRAVRENYGRIAQAPHDCCCGGPSPCCGTPGTDAVDDMSQKLGYSREELSAAPAGSGLGLGCGNPLAIAALRPGETVLDLGSGGGFDCFLAARAVGAGGSVIGVDMTPEMVARARANAAEGGYANVDFRLGEIERLPVADGSVDCIISNCVINLSPDKPAVLAEAFRVLKPGGRLAVSDIVATAELPAEVKQNLAAYAGCIAGAASIPELRSMLEEAGFTGIEITPKDESREFIREWLPGSCVEDCIVSAAIRAVKPVAAEGA